MDYKYYEVLRKLSRLYFIEPEIKEALGERLGGALIVMAEFTMQDLAKQDGPDEEDIALVVGSRSRLMQIEKMLKEAPIGDILDKFNMSGREFFTLFALDMALMCWSKEVMEEIAARVKAKEQK